MAVRNIEQVVGHVPPHNLEAEESVLGAMVISPNAIAAVTEIVQSHKTVETVEQIRLASA